MTTLIHATAILDEPFRLFQGGKVPYDIEYRDTSLGENIGIGAFAVIGRGAALGDGVVIDHHCIVEPNATIGSRTLLIYRAIVGGESVIGEDCVIGGFIAERTIIGAKSRVFGQLIHRQVDSTLSWDEHEEPEPSPIVGENSFIGFGAIVVGGVQIGPNAFVCAGAIVTRDVPPYTIASGTNRHASAGMWRGTLAQNPALGTTNEPTA